MKSLATCFVRAIPATIWAATALAQSPAHLYPGVSFSTGGRPAALAAGDLDSDGDLDIVTATTMPGGIAVLLADGQGAFGSPVGYAGDATTSIALGDLDADGDLDAIGTTPSADGLIVRLGDGAGGFGLPALFPAGDEPTFAALGDLDGDGALDAVALSPWANIVSVLLGDGAGGFGTASNMFVRRTPVHVLIRDWNGDAIPDLVTANAHSNDVAVQLGAGDGSFPTQVRFRLPHAGLLAYGDLNADGHLDLAVTSSTVTLLYGDDKVACCSGRACSQEPSGRSQAWPWRT